MQIELNSIPTVIETVYTGSLTYEEITHPFMIIETINQRNEYKIEVRWYFKQVPAAAKSFAPNIIEQFYKQKAYKK